MVQITFTFSVTFVLAVTAIAIVPVVSLPFGDGNPGSHPTIPTSSDVNDPHYVPPYDELQISKDEFKKVQGGLSSSSINTEELIKHGTELLQEHNFIPVIPVSSSSFPQNHQSTSNHPNLPFVPPPHSPNLPLPPSHPPSTSHGTINANLSPNSPYHLPPVNTQHEARDPTGHKVSNLNQAQGSSSMKRKAGDAGLTSGHQSGQASGSKTINILPPQPEQADPVQQRFDEAHRKAMDAMHSKKQPGDKRRRLG